MINLFKLVGNGRSSFAIKGKEKSFASYLVFGKGKDRVSYGFVHNVSGNPVGTVEYKFAMKDFSKELQTRGLI